MRMPGEGLSVLYAESNKNDTDEIVRFSRNHFSIDDMG